MRHLPGPVLLFVTLDDDCVWFRYAGQRTDRYRTAEPAVFRDVALRTTRRDATRDGWFS